VVSLRVRDGHITHVASHLRPERGEQVYDGQGRWAIPGLWDAHVHMAQWATTLGRLDLAGATGPDDVLARVRSHLTTTPGPRVIEGWGYRSATWSRQPTVAELDAVTGERPVVLISGDLHNGWLNSAALRALGVPHRDDALTEDDWFAAFRRLDELPGAAGQSVSGVVEAVRQASSKGVVGIVDMELAPNYSAWPALFEEGVTGLRVRGATYAEHLDEVIAAGLTTGAPLASGGGLLTMGPLKIISDGSLNTGTAFCCEPYAASPGRPPERGQSNVSQDELTALLKKAEAAGLEVAVHAIGDAAFIGALDAFEASGAGGSIEHAQLVASEDLARMARLGIRASVQPAHLLDDRDPTMQIWPDRAGRCFALAALSAAGVELAFGSDAPVSPLDPWLAMAAAVHRSADAREPWQPEQALTAAEALAASVDGQPTLGLGSRADIAILDRDPLSNECLSSAEVGRNLRETVVTATFVAGRQTHG
jgi:predicted amidohydrolase YtcJ